MGSLGGLNLFNCGIMTETIECFLVMRMKRMCNI